MRHFQNIAIHTDEIRRLGLVLVANMNIFFSACHYCYSFNENYTL